MTKKPTTTPPGDLDAAGKHHLTAILEARSDLNKADMGLAIEAARTYSLLQREWAAFGASGEDGVLMLSNGAPAINPRLRLIDTLQRSLSALHRSLRVRPDERPEAAEPVEDPIFKVVK